MDSITVANYRCFQERQTARLAPLTLLIGENSTGKTSFLALIRALWDVAYGQRVPDFKEDPYDLGSFRDIAYYNNGSDIATASFIAGFGLDRKDREQVGGRGPLYFETTFQKSGTRPIPVRRYFTQDAYAVEELHKDEKVDNIRLTTAKGTWQRRVREPTSFLRFSGRLDLEDTLTPVFFYLTPDVNETGRDAFRPVSGSSKLTEHDLDSLMMLAYLYHWSPERRPFASAPVRSKPHRTYDPSRPTPDPEGVYVPMYLANLYSQDRMAWKALREKLQHFGRDAGLFDELLVKPLGERDGGPFQIEILKSGPDIRGPYRNLIDVGYGVSQVLPLVTELLREDAPSVFLLQQPEVHLHPSAQAALGSLFCQIANAERQLIIETHSDYILDRIRMDIRDNASALTPDDVSVLFFERRNTDVYIHSLTFDRMGNVLGAPSGYRRFFKREVRKSLGM